MIQARQATVLPKISVKASPNSFLAPALFQAGRTHRVSGHFFVAAHHPWLMMHPTTKTRFAASCVVTLWGKRQALRGLFFIRNSGESAHEQRSPATSILAQYADYADRSQACLEHDRDSPGLDVFAILCQLGDVDRSLCRCATRGRGVRHESPPAALLRPSFSGGPWVHKSGRQASACRGHRAQGISGLVRM